MLLSYLVYNISPESAKRQYAILPFGTREQSAPDSFPANLTQSCGLCSISAAGVTILAAFNAPDEKWYTITRLIPVPGRPLIPVRGERKMNIGLLSDIFSRGARDIPAVCDVDLSRYMGTWYEIARLHNTFEEGLDHVTAFYQLRSDGKVDVTNTGVKGGKKRSAKAVAWVPDQQCPGKLLVSFLRPMRSQYNIIRLDANYRYAVVAGSRMNNLWILSREPHMGDDLYDELVHFVSRAGFDGNRLIKIKQAD